MDPIVLCNVSVTVDGRSILRNISLDVKEGETVVVLGTSGAGKSSILKVILGIWKPDHGTVTIGGVDMSHGDSDALDKVRQSMGIVFQSNALFDSLSVRENVGYFLRRKKDLSKADIASRVDEALAFVRMEEAAGLFPEELSGGMKKRVAIARAVAAHPAIVLYDEPTTGLDPVNARAVLDVIGRLKDLGSTSLVVTHNLNDAFAVGDRFVFVKNGGIVVAGNGADLLASSDPLVRSFLDDRRKEPSLRQENALLRAARTNHATAVEVA